MLAIPLLAIYLFNVAGYQILFSWIIQHSDKLLVQRLDQNQYSDEDLLQLKLPFSLPYCNNQTDYERIDGEVNYKGVYYRYVKRKVCNDTLYILCLKNEAKTGLQDAQTDYAKKAADLPVEKHNTSGKKVNSLSEHDPQQTEYSFAASAQASGQRTRFFASPLYSSVLDSNFQPPESAA